MSESVLIVGNNLCPECKKEMNWVEDEGQLRQYFCSCGYHSKTLYEWNIEMNERFKEMLGVIR